jgi:hypothetical protein
MLSRTPGQSPEPGTEVIKVDEGAYLVNKMPLVTPYIHAMGFTVGPELPPAPGGTVTMP